MKATILNILRVFSCFAFLTAVTVPAHADEEPPKEKFKYVNLPICKSTIDLSEEEEEEANTYMYMGTDGKVHIVDLRGHGCGDDFTQSAGNCLRSGGGIAMSALGQLTCWSVSTAPRFNLKAVGMADCLKSGNSLVFADIRMACVVTPRAVKEKLAADVKAILPPLKAVPVPGMRKAQ